MGKPCYKTCRIIAHSTDLNGLRHFLFVEEFNGKICLPGGTKEKGETFLESAKREFYEEAGVTIDMQFLVKRPIKYMKVYSIELKMEELTELTPVDPEIRRAFWIAEDQLDSTEKVKSSHRKLIRDLLLEAVLKAASFFILFKKNTS
ncbi:MAG: NUDIX hydrolase [bacterium]